MEQSHSWEADRSAASQEIPRILWNPKIHYRIHNRLHLSLSSTCLPIPVLKVHFNIIFPYAKYINFISCSFHKADHSNHQVMITDIVVMSFHILGNSHCYSTVSLTGHKILHSHKLIECVLKVCSLFRHAFLHNTRLLKSQRS